ncbi:hypothetical protein KEJ44_03590 [Candidatus Bathyarchaeota archaeon]|nr:hypothetical protein [Candidatus Bathyarchaeota archaeon]
MEADGGLTLMAKVEENRLSEVLAGILPPPERVFTPPMDESNAIEQRHILIYGGPGSGKTNAFRHMAECLARLYGSRFLHVACTEADLAGLLARISPSHVVQLLCCEDMTRVRQPEDAIHGYFTIRHLMARRTGGRHGLIVTAFTTHDLYGVQPKSLRTSCDLFLFLESPANPHDERLAVEMLGAEVYEKLKQVEQLRLSQPEYKGWAAYSTKWRRGMAYIPKAEYQLQPQHPPQLLESAVALAQRILGRRMERMDEEVGGLHEEVLRLLRDGVTRLPSINSELRMFHPDEVEAALFDLERMGYVKLRGPRNRVLMLLFSEWLLTRKGADYLKALGGSKT